MSRQNSRWLAQRYKKQGGMCFYCRRNIYLRSPGSTILPKLDALEVVATPSKSLGHTLDHVVPLAFGGNNNHRNIVLSCSICNSDKGSRMPTEKELTALDSLNDRPWDYHK